MEKNYINELDYVESYPKNLKYYIHFPCKLKKKLNLKITIYINKRFAVRHNHILNLFKI